MRKKHANQVIEDQTQELLSSNSKGYFIDIIVHKNTEETDDEKTAQSQAKATGTRYYKGLLHDYAGQTHMESKP